MIPDQTTSPDHPHTETDFSRGINLAPLGSVSGSQIEQAVQEATPTQNKALIIIQDTAPDVAGNTRYKRYFWVKSADPDPKKWTLRAWKGPSLFEDGWVVMNQAFDAGVVPLTALSLSGAVSGYFLGINPDGVWEILPIPANSITALSVDKLTAGTPWQILVSGTNAVAQWRNFVDLATANAGVCPISFLSPGAANTALETDSTGKPVWNPKSGGPDSLQLLPLAPPAGSVMGVLAGTRAWLDGSYVAGIIPNASISLEKLLSTTTPAAGDIICWSGTKYQNCPLFKFSAQIAIPTVTPWTASVAHGLVNIAPAFFSGRFICQTADVGYVAGNIVPIYATVFTTDQPPPLYATGTDLVMRFNVGGNYISMTNPGTGVQTAIIPANWKFEFVWI